MTSFESPAAPVEHHPVDREHFLSQELHRQYAAEVAALRSCTLLEPIITHDDGLTIETGEGITAMNGTQYELPSAEKIATHFSQEKYREKMRQGFTKLLIVPFGYPLATIRARYSQEILKHHKAGTLLDKDGNKLDLDTNQPLYVANEFDHSDETGDLVYYPTEFDKQNHGGRTKQELLEDPSQPFPGFHILLIRPNLTIPRQGTAQTTNGRKDLETNQSSEQYLKTLQTNSTHSHEQGFTLEDQLTLAIIHLNQTNQVIDDWDYNGKKPKDAASFAIGNFHKLSGRVLYANWSRVVRQASVGRDYPGAAGERDGVRVAVG